VHDLATAVPVAAERAFLRRLEGGCQVPIAAHAEPTGGGGPLRLHGRVISIGGESMVEGHEVGPAHDEDEAAALGSALAERLLADGGGTILAETRSAGAPAVSEP
jgi:hydroxymethylbilane synthase